MRYDEKLEEFWYNAFKASLEQIYAWQKSKKNQN